MTQERPSEDAILQIVGRSPGRKATDIARELGIDKTQINALLYGPLKGKVRQDAQYRWWPVDTVTASAATSSPPVLPKTDIGRLCQYYLECMSQELESGVSAFASSRFDLDYAELAGNPFQENTDIFTGDAVRRVLNQYRTKKHQLVLFLGYPTRLRLQRSRKSNWEGFMVDPVLLFPIEVDSETGPRLSDETPILNFAVLGAMNTVGAGRTMEEAMRLSEELGLLTANEGIPDPEDLILRLRDICPEWDWREEIDPNEPSTGTRLSEIKQAGIYNRAVLLTAERSPYTRGLETELAALQRASDEQLALTQLGFWLSGCKTESALPPTIPLLEPLPLNSEQRLAVQRGLTQPLTVITGPPGTGKSQVVTSLLVNAAYQGKKVLFASKNNKAVDVVEKRVNGLGPRPVLLRMGANELRSRLAEYLSNLLAATATEDDRTQFEEHRVIHDRLCKEIGQLEKKEEQLLAARNRVDKLEQQVESARELFGDDVFATFAAINVSEIEAVTKSMRVKALRAFRTKQGFFVRLFWPFIAKTRFEDMTSYARSARDLIAKVGGLLPAATPTDANVSDYLASIEGSLVRIPKAKAVKEYFHALVQIQQLPSIEELAKSQSELTKQLASNSKKLWSAWLRLQPTKLKQDQRKALRDYSAILQLMVKADEENKRIGREIISKNRKLYPEVVKTLSCWAVTSLSARGRIPMEPAFFDILIIDEASQCDIASALPLLFRAKSVVIIGDPNQLKHISSVPVVKDRQLLVKHDLVNDFVGWSYSVTSLFDLASGFTDAGEMVTLRDHHRSHSDIITFSNDHFYEGRLRVATRYSKLKLPARDEPVVRWIFVVGDVQRPSSGGAVNRREAEAVVQQLSELALHRAYRGSIGVVSPFRAQARLINELVSQNGPLYERLNAADFLADTVHSFQGDERDIMIFSPVVSKGITERALGFLRGNKNLFNVAITRARAALWTVGDMQAALSSNVDYLAAFARYTQTIGEQRAEVDERKQDFGPEYPPVRNPERVSDWERFLYETLYLNGIHPVPQYPEETYSLDFAVFDGTRKLNIEVDGERYHKDWTGELCRRDMIRNQRLIELGWDVKRFWVYQVRDDIEGCVRWVLDWLSAEPPAEKEIDPEMPPTTLEDSYDNAQVIPPTEHGRLLHDSKEDGGFIPPRNPGDTGFLTLDQW